MEDVFAPHYDKYFCATWAHPSIDKSLLSPCRIDWQSYAVAECQKCTLEVFLETLWIHAAFLLLLYDDVIRMLL